MRFSSAILLALPALAVAQDQQPLGEKLKDWFYKATEKVTEYVPSSIPTPKSPVAAAAGKVAEYVVRPMNNNNWPNILKPNPNAPNGEPEEWMVFFTGGNKTCQGKCGNITTEWNKAVSLLAPLPGRPNLAQVNCDDAHLLCGSWNAIVPSIWHLLIPQPLQDQSLPAPTVRQITLNRVNDTATDIARIHVDKQYETYTPYEGPFHPWTGVMHQFNLAVPYAYVIQGFAALPPWVPMVAISFISRSFIGRRAQAPRGGAPPAGSAPQRSS